MKLIVLPNILTNSAYVKGLRQPLESIAEILDEQGQHSFASALRNAATITDTFAEVNLDKSAVLP